jgi:excisionase family DNA binding protein
MVLFTHALAIRGATFMAEQQRELITTVEAERRTKLTRNYITLLLREKKLEGYRPSRDWLVYADSLEEFVKTDRKRGPKPRKTPA